MCGLAGFVDARLGEAEASRRLADMLTSIAYRGPDDSGTWLEGPVAIGHRRLAIVDLSPLGHQPMVSNSGRLVMAFNGEIYNHKLLRKELEERGCSFRGHSDTEVLLALIEEGGLEAALHKCVGMFALAVWDRSARKLQLARDRFGEKPLYYGWHGGAFVFGSELKALTLHPAFAKEPDRDSLVEILRFGYVLAPHSIYQSTYKVRPGTLITLQLPQGSQHLTKENSLVAEVTYWSHQDSVLRAMERPFAGSLADAAAELEVLLTDAVRLQMQADVPLGAFLSGGVDSSAVVSLMQQQSSQRVRTYSIGFEFDSFNEAPYAKAVAGQIGTHHTELYVGQADALAVIPLLPAMYDEPVADSSQISTHVVAKLARNDMTVVLTGDGGDELFCGYNKYLLGRRFTALAGRRLLAATLGVMPWNGIEKSASLLPRPLRTRFAAARFKALHRLLASPGHRQMAEFFSELYRDSHELVLGGRLRASPFSAARPARLEELYEPMAMLLDRETYLPDDVLAKVDRATMSVSLESRAPLLDHRIAEFAASLPLQYLVNGGQTKRVLRQLLYKRVSPDLVDRPKAGFSVPVTKWLRLELNTWATDLLNSRKCADLLDMDRCRALFDVHNRGERDMSAVCWAVLSILGWAEQWL